MSDKQFSNQQRRRMQMSATRFAEFNHMKNARSDRRKIRQNLQIILAGLKVHPVKNAHKIELVTSEINKLEEIGKRNKFHSGGAGHRVSTGNNPVEIIDVSSTLSIQQMISQNPLKENYYEAKIRVENLLSLFESSALNSLEEVDSLMSMLNAKKDDFRIWVTASHNIFLNLYTKLNDSQKTEISTIASKISSRWCNINEKLKNEKAKFMAILPMEKEEEPLAWLREQENKLTQLKAPWSIDSNATKIKQIEIFICNFTGAHQIEGIELSLTLEGDEFNYRVCTMLQGINSFKESVVEHSKLCSSYTCFMLELQAAFNFIEKMIDSDLPASGVTSWIAKQDQLHNNLCSTSKKIVDFSYFLDRVVFVKDLDDITTKWLLIKERILCKVKEQESWEMQKKIADKEFALDEISKMCENINKVLGQIDFCSEKQYSSCQKTIQGWLSGVQKSHDFLTAYKIQIDELVVEVKTSKIEVPEATLCFQRHRNLLSSTHVLLEYYSFVSTFIQTLKRQNASCERKVPLIGKFVDEDITKQNVADLDDFLFELEDFKHVFSTHTLSEVELHKFEKDLKDQEKKINDLKQKFLLSKAPIPQTDAATTLVPDYTASIDNTQMDIDDTEEVVTVATTSAVGYPPVCQPPTEIDKNDPDVIRLTELEWGGKIPDLFPARKNRIPVSRKTVFRVWTRLPVQNLPQSETNIWDAVVSSCTGPNEFCLHLKMRLKDLDRLQAHITRFCIASNLVAVTNPIIGLDCLVKYRQDGKWYRAVISNIRKEKIEILFVDYGNIQLCVSAELFELPDQFMKLESFAFRCTLAGIRKSKPWTDDDNAKFCEFNNEEDDCKVHFLNKKDGEHYCVRLFKNGQLLNDQFGMACLQNPKICLDTLVHVPKDNGYLIETFNNCENFTLIQQPNDEFQTFDEDLQSFYTSLSDSELNILANEDLYPGRSCVILDAESKFQRAVVQEMNGFNGNVSLFLVDRGVFLTRKQFKTDFKIMLSEFAIEPTLSCRSKLQGLRRSSLRDDWTESLYFSNLRKEKNLSVTFVRQLEFGLWEVNLNFPAIVDFREELVNKHFAEHYVEYNHYH